MLLLALEEGDVTGSSVEDMRQWEGGTALRGVGHQNGCYMKNEAQRLARERVPGKSGHGAPGNHRHKAYSWGGGGGEMPDPGLEA